MPSSARRSAFLGLAVLLLVCATWGTAAGLPPVQRSVLDNGLALLVSEEHSLPFVTMSLLVKSGSKDDPDGREGLADVTASCLLLGAAGRSLQEINEELDFMGAQMGADASRDYTIVSLKVLRKDFERAFPIFMDVVLKPTFPSDEVKKEIDRSVAAIRASEDQPGVVADRAFMKALYNGGPYGHPKEGTVKSVSGLDRRMMQTFHRAHYNPNNAILVVAGDIDGTLVKGYMIPRLEKWPKGGAAPQAIQLRFADRKETVKINKPVTQSNIVIGNGGLSRENPDYYAALVMNYILGGGGLTSRLMDDIRIKKGLAYSVGSFFEGRKYPGPFEVYLQTKNLSTKDAIKGVMEELERMRSGLVSEKELEDAKKYLVGSFPQRFSTQGRIASFFAQVEYFGLGLDYAGRYPSIINAITRGDVQRVAKEYIRPDRAVTVIVADLKEAGLE
jgi:zinc protease